MARGIVIAVLLALGMALPLQAADAKKGVIASSRDTALIQLKIRTVELTLVHSENQPPLAVEVWESQPSRVRLFLWLLPNAGYVPGEPAVVAARMERPLEEKTFRKDGGLLKTIDAFVRGMSPAWHALEQEAFVDECYQALKAGGECRRLVKGTMVSFAPISGDRFRAEARRE